MFKKMLCMLVALCLGLCGFAIAEGAGAVTAAELEALLDLARQYGVSPDQIKAKFNVPALESLTKTQCSRAIDELSGKAA